MNLSFYEVAKELTDHESYVIFVPNYYPDVNEERLPKVSFVIPTYGSARTISRCLKSIRNQRYPTLEIIVVDGYSEDGTVQIAEKLGAKVYMFDGLLGEARQIGIEKSSGEIVALFDSDIIIPHSEWLTDAVKKFYVNENVSTVWPYSIRPPDSPLMSKFFSTYSWSILLNLAKNGKGILGGGHSLFRKKCIDEVGGIDIRLHEFEDFNLAKKLKNKGYKIVFHQDPLYHDSRVSFRETIQKEFSRAKSSKKFGISKLTGLSRSEWAYYHIVLGIKGMFKGLLISRDTSWVMFPLFAIIRSIAYTLTNLLL